MNKSQHFNVSEKSGVYRAIYERRDIRREFLPRPISKKLLLKLLDAAHHSGSVGFMQPWNFVVITERKVKQQVKQLFEQENAKAARNYNGKKRKLYESLKLEGIVESPINLCVTCDRKRGGLHVIGRNTILETDFFSTSCAIQNLWLAARAEGIGVGWVSILTNTGLRKILNIPKRVVPVAYLCLGYVTHFPKQPALKTVGWRDRLPLKELIYRESWGQR